MGLFSRFCNWFRDCDEVVYTKKVRYYNNNKEFTPTPETEIALNKAFDAADKAFKEANKAFDEANKAFDELRKSK